MKAHKILFCIVILTMFIFSGQNAFSTVHYLYFNDFSSYIGPEWSTSHEDGLTISTTPSGENFLGRDPLYGFQNETVRLALTGLPMNSILDVSFDLFIINSWDGNTPGEYGPDYWSFGVEGESPLLYTTFRNTSDQDYQSYPNNYYAENPYRTGAIENNTLGYTFYGDAVYNLNFNVAYTGNSVTLEFMASNLQTYSIEDESWGLDNVSVAVIPEPSTVMLLGAGLLSLCCFGKLRKKKCHKS